ncbi:hypothetical protein MRX96_036217 [Rhipicephalus microplus]
MIPKPTAGKPSGPVSKGSARIAQLKRNLVKWHPRDTPKMSADDIVVVLKACETLLAKTAFQTEDLGVAVAQYVGGEAADTLSVCENRPHPPTRHRRGHTWRETKGPHKITWRDIVTGTKADSAQGHPLSGRPWAAADPGLAASMENMEKENRELRQELAKARKQNEKSTRKIEELQQTLNEILKRMGGHPAETPSSGASSSHTAADERDPTSAVGDGDTDMGCGGEYEAPVAVGSKRKSPSDSQQ